MSTAEQRLTAEMDFQAANSYELSELVRGVVIPVVPPGLEHGFVSSRLCFLLGEYLKVHNVGRASLGSGILTRRNPDTVRGADLSF